jgi:hypothetical protein
MIPYRRIPILAIFALIFLFSAGCVGYPGPEKATIPVAPGEPVTTSLPATMVTLPVSPTTAAQGTSRLPELVPAWCPQRGNESFWITLGPIPDLHRGDLATISGETNIPVGQTLEILIMESSFHPHCKCCFDDDLIAGVKVRKGSGCNHTFTLVFDSTNLRPQEYLVTARYMEDKAVSNGRVFTVFKNYTTTSMPAADIPQNLSMDTPLTLNPIGKVKQGDMLVITGYTGKPDRAILYSIHDARYSAGCWSLCTGELVRGTMYPDTYGEIPQVFSFRFDTSSFDTGRYTITLDAPCANENTENWFIIGS